MTTVRKGNGVRQRISAKSAEKLSARMDKTDEAPIDIMLNTMDLFYAEAMEFKAKAAKAGSAKARTKNLSEMRTALARASNVADKIAPYMHPRLSSTVLTGDKDADAIKLDVTTLSKLNAGELDMLESLLSKVKS